MRSEPSSPVPATGRTTPTPIRFQPCSRFQSSSIRCEPHRSTQSTRDLQVESFSNDAGGVSRAVEPAPCASGAEDSLAPPPDDVVSTLTPTTSSGEAGRTSSSAGAARRIAWSAAPVSVTWVIRTGAAVSDSIPTTALARSPTPPRSRLPYPFPCPCQYQCRVRCPRRCPFRPPSPPRTSPRRSSARGAATGEALAWVGSSSPRTRPEERSRCPRHPRDASIAPRGADGQSRRDPS